MPCLPTFWRMLPLLALLTGLACKGTSTVADDAQSQFAGEDNNTTAHATPTPTPTSGTSGGTSVPSAAPTATSTSAPTPAPSSIAGAVLRPSQLDQAGLDAALTSFYTQWKSTYLTQGQCPSGQLYVNSSGDAGGGSSISVSEAHGYGMLALVLMAPHDSAARGQFDQMVSFLLAHPSAAGSGLMAWNIDAPCTSVSGAGSASDGDLDIAYALLLAHSTWGSAGAVDYLTQAKRIINAIMATEVNQQGHFITLWENVSTSDSHYGGMRVSDMMMDHFRAFALATGDDRWNTVVTSGYSILATLQSASTAALLPDFAINLLSSAAPAGTNFLEGAHDGQYYYNACRLPWRIASDYLLNGDTRAHDITHALVNALRTRTNGNASAIVDGYDLQGNSFGTNNNLSFMAPLAVGAMAAGNQAWVDALWQAVVTKSMSSDQYYGNTIKLMSMITIAGHYRAP